MERKRKARTYKKVYTYSQTYQTGSKGWYIRKTETDEAIEKKIEKWYNRPAGSRVYGMSQADKEYYNSKAAEYYRLKNRIAQLDAVKDYTQINMLNYRLAKIREDFHNLPVWLEDKKNRPEDY